MKHVSLAAGVILMAASTAAAQQQPDRLIDMQVIASSLGVTCTYCHAGRGAPPALTASGKPRQEVAREMIAMTRALNATVQTAAGKPANETIQVGCITCHRGVPIPRQLTDVLWTTTVRQGGAAAVAQYRELRAQFYGRQAYDFGEDTLITIASRIGQARPEDAIALMDLNLEFFPKSLRSYVTLAIAQSRTDAAAAIGSLKKALEIDPDNGEVKGRLYQLEQLVERQNRIRPQ
jgi:tetratricopeptide (TPR) repeat protein